MDKDRVDWNIHCIHGEKGFTYQSVGAEKYCGLEIELNLSVQAKMGMMILNTVVFKCIEKGEVLKENSALEEVFTVPIKVVKMNPIHPGFDGQKVYRIIVPDVNGKFPGDDGCAKEYDSQLDDFVQILGKENKA